jgi:hypothetical protein
MKIYTIPIIGIIGLGKGDFGCSNTPPHKKKLMINNSYLISMFYNINIDLDQIPSEDISYLCPW